MLSVQFYGIKHTCIVQLSGMTFFLAFNIYIKSI